LNSARSHYRDIGSEGSAGRIAQEGKAYVVVIGIDRYDRWDPLYNAVSDARGTLQVFQRLGFEALGVPLFDEMATGDALRRLVTDELATLGTSDSLVLFFAGHGHTLSRSYHGGTTVKDGYIIPVDGDPPGGKLGTWLRLENWLAEVTRIPAKHILVVLDACHSGFALGPIIQGRSRGGRCGPRELLEDLRARRSRRIITSALDDQLALDSGPVPGHSLFTGYLIEGLTGGLVTRSGRTTVTGSEIAQYVQRRVSEYPGCRQTPDFGALALDDRGEMVVHLASQPVELEIVATSPAFPAASIHAAHQRVPTASPHAVTLRSAKGSFAVGGPPAVESGASQMLVPPVEALSHTPAASPPSESAETPSRDHGSGTDPDATQAGTTRRYRTHRRFLGRLAAVVGSRPYVVPVLGVAFYATLCSGLVLWCSPEQPPQAAVMPAQPGASVDGGLLTDATSVSVDAASPADALESSNPFVATGEIRVQAHQVTRGEYAIYLASLPAAMRASATPLRDWDDTAPEDPVSWTRYEQAVSFCRAIAARLPTFAEWERASGGAWGLDPTGRRRGPLREWTSEVVDGWIRVAGATAAMTARQQAEALHDVLLLGRAANFEDRAAPDAAAVASKEVGIRCVKN
jgi:uncharacterized caspase-like protein